MAELNTPFVGETIVMPTWESIEAPHGAKKEDIHMKKLFALLALALVLAPVVMMLIESTTPEVVVLPAGGKCLVGIDPDAGRSRPWPVPLTAPTVPVSVARAWEPATPVPTVAPRQPRQPVPVAYPCWDRPEPAPKPNPLAP